MLSFRYYFIFFASFRTINERIRKSSVLILRISSLVDSLHTGTAAAPYAIFCGKIENNQKRKFIVCRGVCLYYVNLCYISSPCTGMASKNALLCDERATIDQCHGGYRAITTTSKHRSQVRRRELFRLNGAISLERKTNGRAEKGIIFFVLFFNFSNNFFLLSPTKIYCVCGNISLAGDDTTVPSEFVINSLE